VYGKVVSLKRDRKDKDKDEDPPAGSDQRMKRRKTSKDAESSKGSKLKESKSTSSSKDNTRSQPKSSGKSPQAKEPIHMIDDIEVLQNQGQDMGNTNDQPNVEVTPKHDWFKKPKRPSTPNSDWNVGKSPLPLIMDRGREVVPVDYFINNDFEYLRGGSSSWKYTTSTTKTKAAKYDIQGIEDMVPSLWIPVKVSHDRYVVWGISHWGPKRQRFYGFTSNKVSKHDAYSTKRFIAVTKVKIMKWYDYGYPEEIEVQRED
nr:hypothetical protein [Tanacetum cinerariifolium]